MNFADFPSLYLRRIVQASSRIAAATASEATVAIAGRGIEVTADFWSPADVELNDDEMDPGESDGDGSVGGRVLVGVASVVEVGLSIGLDAGGTMEESELGSRPSVAAMFATKDEDSMIEVSEKSSVAGRRCSTGTTGEGEVRVCLGRYI